MKKIAFLDCYSGISGDMCLGAIIDAGVDISRIEEELKKIGIKGYKLSDKKVLRAGISATKVDVKINPSKKSKAVQWVDIEKLILQSKLAEDIKQKGLYIFKKLFEVEAKVHGSKFEDAHLHELGGTDCIIDIFGTIIGFKFLSINDLYVSPVNLGSGKIQTSHGILPVPAPATIELLKGYPVYSTDTSFELTTPTGAAIISGLGAKPSYLPEMSVEVIGYGAGKKDFIDKPNTLRILIGKEITSLYGEYVMVIETNIDDMNPQIYEYIMEKLFLAGALDVFLENIIMKKGRPAIKLSVIAKEPETEKILDILFKETTTIGIRFHKVYRKILHREINKIKTGYGDIRIKKSSLNDEYNKFSLEYDDLKKIAKKTEIPIKKLEKLLKYYVIK